ncbi:MAG TPA: hypothetical protein VG944_03390, partial [Fimbriimonas sp.]|nr:hypothetical protein [Fimbriimonas sp.]
MPPTMHVDPRRSTGGYEGHTPTHSEPTFPIASGPGQIHVDPPRQGTVGKLGYYHERQGKELRIKHKNPRWGDHWRDGYYCPPGVTINLICTTYVENPSDADCFVSPWYYYPTLPPYVASDSVQVDQDGDMDWNLGVIVTPRNRYGDVPLAYAVDELNNSFLKQDGHAVDELISSDKVGIFVDGEYEYSMDG